MFRYRRDYFPKDLRYYRERRGYSQARFAEMLGISQNYWSNIECGRRRLPVTLANAVIDSLKIYCNHLDFIEDLCIRPLDDNDAPRKRGRKSKTPRVAS